ncbi:hypothetical protein PF005_g13433 [Phytophthora fragariae]|uniref:RxLR effector protein n=2 Tax=Phytophthora TaxID=4783 RepID=A0A6A3EPE1_9STRA|nr:hypothetical protein PF003_g12876 [Phytophthora fragariae]KAE8982716.1 hypothetical protein PR002_g23455 [Phytophthora rubi]KAE8935315.1 hypothetical protein PF009_g14742 [Phytophthora fragariae]KAE8985118.1 hypothetical protein PR001_g22988 [Phytophthora rubi]KAE9006100.1 hypothetical protein PF011_g11751 [Phytophthora fragariae]
MKNFVAIVALLLATSVSAHEASHLTIKSNAKSVSQHHVEERVVDHKALAKKQDMFYRMAHMKSTPWDAQPAEREAKCEDLCMLNDFWEFQQVRNCLNRPTSLCSIYKTGLASMDVVLTVAECTCGDNSTSSSASFDDSGSA